MKSTVKIEEAIEIITAAFLPLHCIAESFDHNHRIRFRIFHKNEPVLSVDEILKSQFSDRSRLISIIDSARSNLLNREFSLADRRNVND